MPLQQTLPQEEMQEMQMHYRIASLSVLLAMSPLTGVHAQS